MVLQKQEDICRVGEYITALKGSKKFGPQVIYQKTIPEVTPQFADDPLLFSENIQNCLNEIGVRRLYSHQQEAIINLRARKNIIVATPTASGKSLIYNLPMLESLQKNKDVHALYIFPLKALAQDQLKTLNTFASKSKLVHHKTGIGAIYDGDTTPYHRKKIRSKTPPVLMTNPEMLHLSFLPYHERWAHFFKNLQYIVIDEVHTYRGVFGSHMAWVLARLKRIIQKYGSRPQFILLSATIGNPEELGKKLIQEDVLTITESGSLQPKKHVLLLNPWDSAAYTASQMLESALKRELRTIVYTQSRKMTELITLWTQPRLGELASKLSSYRAGFLPEERREIEERLANGELLGVISTSALELGIDIGSLDLCILVGYPGSIMATWQRGGRVGRGSKESAVFLIAQEDALDQYFMRNPEDFFSREVESAVLNLENETISERHLHCAAAEIPLKGDEILFSNKQYVQSIHKLTQEGTLLQSHLGDNWYSTRKLPQRYVHLRGNGNQVTIINSENGEILGEVDSARALLECHTGAVYLHRANKWIVEKLDLLAHEAVVKKFDGTFFTRPMSSKRTEIINIIKQKNLWGCRVSFGRVIVRERITGYQKKSSLTHKLIATYPLDLPEQILETESVWVELPHEIQKGFEARQLHFMGAIHALEHAMIAMFPLFVLCDRNDIGGISCPLHEQTELATIFIYDGHQGGVGLAKEAYEKIIPLVKNTEVTINTCQCENGCPSCVHSPKCGSGNRPIDKLACLELLQEIVKSKSKDFGTGDGKKHFVALKDSQALQKLDDTALEGEKRTLERKGLVVLPPRYGIFDVETKKSAAEVGGWNRAELMGISVAVVWDSELNGCVTYLENEIEKFIDHLFSLELVVGFNNKRFDNRVISGYSDKNMHTLSTIDLLEEVHNQLGYRVSLDGLAAETLGTKKEGSGLLALQWYKEGNIEEICKYCIKDVEITRDIFHFGLENGFLLFKNKAGKVVRIPMNIEKSITRELVNPKVK